MYSVELKPEETTDITEDDVLADVIKSLTQQQAEELWRTMVALNPRLAEL
jgi:hypothetical protein